MKEKEMGEQPNQATDRGKNPFGDSYTEAESEPAASPPLTSLRSPYDLSKAMAEQLLGCEMRSLLMDKMSATNETGLVKYWTLPNATG